MTGSGTLLDPFIIWDVNDLQDMELDLNAYYELGQDIDASATVGWHGGQGFAPISDFTGNLDGQGYNITELYIDRRGSDVGLFDSLGGGISDVNLVDCDITGDQVGGFVNFFYAGSLVGCTVSGEVTGGGGQYVGGVAGYIAVGSTVATTWANVSVNGGACGGFVGHNRGNISRCFATGNVESTTSDYAGGFVQSAGAGSSIVDCYATGGVVSDDWEAGGFVSANNNANAIIKNCYSLGAVTATNPAVTGGFAGENRGDIINCFWDTQNSGQATSNGGTGLTSAEMVYGKAFAVAGWVQTIWRLNDGYYPCLIGVAPSCAYSPIPYPPWPPLPPTPPPPIIVTAEVSTLPATNIAENHATLNGVLTDSLARYGEVRFQYGVTSAYGMNTPWQDGFFTGDDFYANITDVGEGSAYHFRAQFRGSPIVSGSDMTFSTLSSLGPVTMVSEELMQILEG